MELNYQKYFLILFLLLTSMKLMNFLETTNASIDSQSTNIIRQPYNANAASRFIELALVIDNPVNCSRNRNTSSIIKRYKDIVNIVNSLFQQFNVFVALVNMTIWNNDRPIPINMSVNYAYNNFKEYAKLLSNDNIDYVGLISPLEGLNFPKDIYPRNISTKMCSSSVAVGIIQDSNCNSDERFIARYLAHILALNMGVAMYVGVDPKKCPVTSNSINPDECCIMSSLSNCTLRWSTDTKESMPAIVEDRNNLPCLNDEPAKLFGGPVCGNGFLESGEDCDCGLKKKCENSCCNAADCRFALRSSCAFGECCKFDCTIESKPNTSVCRKASNKCDLEEYCDGKSEFCPKDKKKEEGKRCTIPLFVGCNGKSSSECLKPYSETEGVCDAKGECLSVVSPNYWIVIAIITIVGIILVLLLSLLIYCLVTKKCNPSRNETSSSQMCIPYHISNPIDQMIDSLRQSSTSYCKPFDEVHGSVRNIDYIEPVDTKNSQLGSASPLSIQTGINNSPTSLDLPSERKYRANEAANKAVPETCLSIS